MRLHLPVPQTEKEIENNRNILSLEVYFCVLNWTFLVEVDNIGLM